MSFISSLLSSLPSFLLLAVGFGFVVFWHELGHFLAAKWAGVKVEQFAVGFGQAMLAWRKGFGFRIGTTRHEYMRRVCKHLGKEYDPKGEDPNGPTQREIREASAALGYSETEYRLNWIPLGGYVKMLGQDDLKPNSTDDDPRAFNRQTIPKRMVIVSAGVIMNVILAAIGFMILFMIGFRVQPAKVARIQPNSPAQLAGWQVADEIYSFDGKRQYNDWTKVNLNAALSGAGETTPAQIKRVVDGKEQILDLPIVPQRGAGASKDFVGLGIGSNALPMLKARERSKDPKEYAEFEKRVKDSSLVLPDASLLMPGDVITEIAGKPVTVNDYAVLDAAVQSSGGKPVTITVRRADGKVEPVQIQPQFELPFNSDFLSFAGMVPRLRIDLIQPTSKAKAKLKPGDIILSVTTGGTNVLRLPTRAKLVGRLTESDKATVTVLRDGNPVTVADIETMKISRDQRGLLVSLSPDMTHPVVAAALDNSPAAGIPQGATILKVGDRPVSNWYEVYDAMKPMLGDPKKPAATSVAITYRDEANNETTKTLALSADDSASLARYVFSPGALVDNGLLAETITPRVAAGPLDAVKQGVIETRDFILQFYLTLRRMATGDVSPKNLMGPVGIFQSGTVFASRGTDWLIWFLAMISANLAVVNFLPIPIVDGGLFTFLLIEKFKGKPVSPKTQAIAQYVGLALLLGVFLFVTYQDVMRLL